MAENWSSAETWAPDVKKFVANADDGVIAAIVRYCGIALRSRDASLVSFTDPVEIDRVRDNFLKKKLGLTQPDETLNQAIAAVGERMKGANFKNRVTVYYLLLEHFGLLHLFGKAGDADDGISGAGLAAGAGAAALGAAALASAAGANDDKVAAAPAAAAPPAASTATPAALAGVAGGGGGKSGFGWLIWLLLGLLLLALLWWLFMRSPATTPVNQAAEGAAAVASDNVTAPAPDANLSAASDLSAAPPEGTISIPTGAGVTVETRDAKPVIKVYFDTGKAEVVPAFAPAATGMKAYLEAHAGSKLAVSGFNDKTGNAAANAELSKNRAQAVKAALVAAGIADATVDLAKPSETTDKSVTNAEARRVEVVVK